MSLYHRFSMCIIVITILLTTLYSQDSKDDRQNDYIAGKWTAKRGETNFYYEFKTNGTYHLVVKSPYFVQNKHGTWSQIGSDINMKQDDSGKPGTGGYSKGRSVKIRLNAANSLEIDGDIATVTERYQYSRIDEVRARRLRMMPDFAKTLMSTDRFQPNGSTTFCNQYVEWYGNVLAGKQLPELNGTAAEQHLKLSKSTDFKSYTIDETAPSKTMNQVQSEANEGKLVFASTKDHIAMVMPLQKGDEMVHSESWNVRVPMISQAGREVFDYKPLSYGFKYDAKKELKFFRLSRKMMS